MKTGTKRTPAKPFYRFVHLLLLIGWLFSSQGVVPAICLAAAVLDGDHSVKVGARISGMTVVLSHEGKSPSELAAHQHDLLCKFLVSLAEQSSREQDHILSFKAVDDASRSEHSSVIVGTPDGVRQAVSTVSPLLPGNGFDTLHVTIGRKWSLVRNAPTPALAGARVMLC